jgi:hypothetical protein
MAEPLRSVDPTLGGFVAPGPAPEPRPSWRRRARRRLGGWASAVLGWAVRPARLIPGVAAVGCAVAGSWLLWGLGVALLVAVPFLLLLDARTPRG